MIIFANRYFYPDQSATSRMVASLAFALAREGAAITVLASRQYHDRPRAPLPADEVIDGVRVHRLATTHFGRRRLAGRLIDYLSYHVLAALWLIGTARRGDICVICTDPPMLSATATLPLRLRGAKLVNWIMDLFPEVAIDLKLINGRGLPARLTLAVRDWSLRQAAVNACPIDTMARYLETRGIAADKLRVEHHWSEGEEIYGVPRAANRLRRAWHFGDELVVGYSGNFGRAHDFSTILEAAQILQQRDDIAFLFIGDGQQRPAVEAEIERRGLSGIKFKPLQPRERLAESLSVADVHLISLLPALERSIVPSKLYGVLAVGRPTLFVGDPRGEVASVIAGGECGLAVEIGDGKGLAARIAELAAHPETVARLGANAKAVYDAYYTREHGVGGWRTLLNGLSGAPGRRLTAPVRQGAKG